MTGTDRIAWTSGHVEALRSVRLPRRRGGYRIADVDRYLDHVAALMNAGRPVQAPTAGTFARSWTAAGYDVPHVDALTAAVQRWQQDLHHGSAAAESAAAQDGPDAPGTGRLAWTQEQADWVRETRFPPARGRRAYDSAEVDNLLDEVLAAMTKGQPLPVVADASFHVPGALRPGYQIRAVDDFLDQLALLEPLR